MPDVNSGLVLCTLRAYFTVTELEVGKSWGSPLSSFLRSRGHNTALVHVIAESKSVVLCSCLSLSPGHASFLMEHSETRISGPHSESTTRSEQQIRKAAACLVRSPAQKGKLGLT